MSGAFDDEVEQLKLKHDAAFAAKYPMATTSKPLSITERFSRVSLGLDQLTGDKLTMPDRTRLAHSHTMGTTGAGKTAYLAHLIKQDIYNRKGVAVLDPHGTTPMSPLASESLFSTIVDYCDRMGLIDDGKVHIVDPGRNTHSIGFNPLAPRPGFASDVIADMMIDCVERVWDQDTHQTPTLRANLRAALVALTELNLPLTYFRTLLDREDATGLRRHAIETVAHEDAREQLKLIQQAASSPKSQDYEINVVGPRNRIIEFTGNAALAAIIGQTTNLLDLVDVMDRSDILLVNLQPTGVAGSQRVQLLGTIILRYLLEFAAERRNREPFFCYVDECQNYLTADVPRLLREVRKRRVGMHLAHQDIASLDAVSPEIKGAIFSNTNVKTFFRVTNTTESRQVVDNFWSRIDYEMPVRSLIRQTVIGNEIIRLESDNLGKQFSDTVGEVETNTGGKTRGRAEGETETAMAASTDIAATTRAEMSVLGSSDGLSQALLPDLSIFGATLPVTVGSLTPNTTGLMASQMASRSDGTSRSDTNAHADTYARGFARSLVVSDLESLSKAISKSLARTAGTSVTHGTSETLRPIFAELPTAVFSRDDVIDMISRDMLRLADGNAFVSALGNTTRITVPYVKPPELAPNKLKEIVTRAFESSRYTSSSAAIKAETDRRAAELAKLTTPSTHKVKQEPKLEIEPQASSSKDLGEPPPMPKVKPAPVKPPKNPRGGKPTLVIDNDKGPPKA